jgi:hypothetical protein
VPVPAKVCATYLATGAIMNSAVEVKSVSSASHTITATSLGGTSGNEVYYYWTGDQPIVYDRNCTVKTLAQLKTGVQFVAYTTDANSIYALQLQ